MDPALLVTAVPLLVAGVVLVVVGRKQRAGTLRRNRVAGLRTSETLRSDAAWHAAHVATAGSITSAGIVLVLGGVLLVVLEPDEELYAAVTLGAAGLTLLLVLAAGIRGHRIARRINQAADPTGG